MKGRSGRKTGDRERDTKRLWACAVPIVIGYLASPRVKSADKVHVALELVKKLAPPPPTESPSFNLSLTLSLFDAMKRSLVSSVPVETNGHADAHR